MAKISAIVQTLNEEKNIENCLQSLNWVDEIIVVDMYSDDKTVEIAQKYTQRIFHHVRTGIVEPARQFALEQASNEWVLIVDADEMISHQLSKLLLQIFRDDLADVIAIPRENYFFGHKMQEGQWNSMTDLQYRCFKKKHLLQWTHLIHRTPSFTPGSRAISITNPNAAIIHFNYTDVSQYIEKMDRYTNVIATQWLSGESNIPNELQELIKEHEKTADGPIGGMVDHLTKTHFMIAFLKYYLMQSYKNKDINYSVTKMYQEIADKIILEHQPPKDKTEQLREYANLGLLLNKQGRLLESENSYKMALEINNTIAELHNNLGEVLYKQGKLEEALVSVEKALEINPEYYEAQWGKAITLLKQGRFKEGFPLYDCRLQRAEFDYLQNKKLWNGENFSGKRLLVCAEQGFGDNIQFVRYLSLVKARGGHVTLSTKPALLRLFTGIAGIDELIEHKSTKDNYDFIIPLLSLPKIFETTLDTIPASLPYLFINDLTQDKWRTLISSPNYKIGLVWAGKSHYMPERSIHLNDFAPLTTLPGITFYSLQKGNGEEQTKSPPPGMNLIDLSPAIDDFADTAGAISQLDLVLSIDTSVAHLAGALGKPVGILLPLSSDWRWLMNREDSPWYPTMRLFRQTSTEDWQHVIRKIRDTLMGLKH